MFRFLFLCFAILGFTSCGTERSYYVLSPVGRPPVSGGPGIGIGPVTMADYLIERPYIAFQSSPNKLEISDLHEWAGDPQNDFQRVLASNVGRHKRSGNVRAYPWNRDSELDYQVIVEVRQFHGTSDGQAVLEAAWRAYRLPGSRLLKSKSTTLYEPVTVDGFEALVAAQSRLVDRLAEEISATLN